MLSNLSLRSWRSHVSGQGNCFRICNCYKDILVSSCSYWVSSQVDHKCLHEKLVLWMKLIHLLAFWFVHFLFKSHSSDTKEKLCLIKKQSLAIENHTQCILFISFLKVFTLKREREREREREKSVLSCTGCCWYSPWVLFVCFRYTSWK